MTREEAIRLLGFLGENWHGLYLQALDMAIAALRYDGPKYVLLSTPPADAQTIDTGVPFTNADHIRSMTDEELATLLSEVEYRRSIGGGGAIWFDDEGALMWLKQPYKEDT